MISDIASFLRDLMSVEQKKIAAQGITHAPTIGAMYEGLTREILSRTIPENLNLQIVEGFIEGVDGRLSTQVDCMLVSGSGRKLPHVSACVWKIELVIAVFEIKKNIFGRELGDFFKKQQMIYKMYDQYAITTKDQFSLEPAFKAFARSTGYYLETIGEVDNLDGLCESMFLRDDLRRSMFLLLVSELLAPIRILFGYEGYVDETALRTGLLDFLCYNMAGQDGYGAYSLPNLIVCRNNSVLKLNSYPYIARLEGDYLHIFASNNENPLRIIIELIWTRLGNQFQASFPEDSNLTNERLAPLLKGKVARIGDKQGWMYEAVEFSKKCLESSSPDMWKPSTLEQQEATVALVAARQGHVDVRDADLQRLPRNTGPMQERLSGVWLQKESCIGPRYTARPIDKSLYTVILPDDESFHASGDANLLFEWASCQDKQLRDA